MFGEEESMSSEFNDERGWEENSPLEKRPYSYAEERNKARERGSRFGKS